MSVKRISLLLTLLVCFVISTSATTTTSGLEATCGYVYDWGTEDMGQQYSTNYISASWAGFETPSSDNNLKTQVNYEWAIISDDLATEAIRLAATEEDSSIRCRDNSGISEKPDVADWSSVDSTYASNYKLTLTPGQTYYVLLRVTTTTTTLNGEVTESVTYTNGAGITISTTTKYTRGNNKNNKDNNNKDNNKGKNKNNKNGKNKPPVIINGGLPSFLESTSSFSSLLFINSSDLSSFLSVSSGLLGWQIALIIIACVFALILLLVLIFIVVGRTKGGDDKYETNVHRNENTEKI
jgi:hypothetical protein